MKYRIKLYIFLVAIASISSATAVAIIYYKTRHQLFQQIQAQLLSVATTASMFVDGEYLKSIENRQEEGSPSYLALKNQLAKMHHGNQTKDLFVTDVYIMKPSQRGENQMIYLADSNSNEDQRHVGDPLEESLLDKAHLEIGYITPRLIHDQYGTWLAGYVPIRDAQNHYVATLGVNLSASDLLRTLSLLIQEGLFAFLGAILIALFAAFFLSKRATDSLDDLCRSVEKIGKGDFTTHAMVTSHDEFATLSQSINAMAEGLQEKERLKNHFAHYVSRHVLEQILRSKDSPGLQGEKKRVTLLFSDIKAFALLAERHPPELIVELLNEYFEAMLPIVFKHKGTLDKLLGNGLMVEFGAPLLDPDAERHALFTALEMRSALDKLSQRWKNAHKPTIQMGIGVHTGMAILGTIGSTLRMEYTAIGDAVNVASRVLQETQEKDADILVSETTYLAVKEEFSFESLGSIKLKGREEPLQLYKLKDYLVS